MLATNLFARSTTKKTRWCSWNTDLAFTTYSLTTVNRSHCTVVCTTTCKGRNYCIPRDPASWGKMAAIPDDCERTATVALPTAASPGFISGEVGISAALDAFSTVYELPLTRFKKGQTDKQTNKQTYGHERSLYLALRATPTRGNKPPNYTTPRGPTPSKSKNVIYLATCNHKICAAQYIGYTTRSLRDRIYEHLQTNTSAIFKHCNQLQKVKFQILTQAPTDTKLDGVPRTQTSRLLLSYYSSRIHGTEEYKGSPAQVIPTQP